MRKIVRILGIFSLVLMTSCGKDKKQTSEVLGEASEVVTDTTKVSEAPISESEPEGFNIEKLPVSEVDLGTFPFFNAPEGAQYINRAKPLDFDFIVFVTPDSIFEVEGKTFRAHVHPDRKTKKNISSSYLIKSYEDAIFQAGGVKVFEGRLDKEQKDRYQTLCTYKGSNGSIDIWNDPIATYVIRRADGNIYIALEKGSGRTTSIQMVQEEAFEQTITYLQSDEIQNDLQTKGKVVLHINFDTDKATLKPEGKDAVDEIFKVLLADKSLNVAINGYTDDTGNALHNQKLSEDRAQTVMNALVDAGIEASRLVAQGFGAENPIADNSTENGKAQNRRVELIKK